jgi:hypothetical protein
MRPLFAATGYPIPPNIRLTCGFPSRQSISAKDRRIGECWASTASKDGHFEIMISPILDDPMRVTGVLAHELIHAAVGLKCGHRGAFRRVALAIGLEGSMPATIEGEQFKRAVAPILEAVGPYPHAELCVGPSSGPKPQRARLIKCECHFHTPDGRCGYAAWTTRKWLNMGPPLCPRPGHGVMRPPKPL